MMFYSSGKGSDSPPLSYHKVGNNTNGLSSPLLAQPPNVDAGRDTNGGEAVGGEPKTKKETDETSDYPLHECVFRGDVKQLSALIRAGHDLSKVDPHGNSALHLAVMLGRRECVHLLCAHGAPVKIKNKQGWSPIAESIRYR